MISSTSVYFLEELGADMTITCHVTCVYLTSGFLRGSIFLVLRSVFAEGATKRYEDSNGGSGRRRRDRIKPVRRLMRARLTYLPLGVTVYTGFTLL